MSTVPSCMTRCCRPIIEELLPATVGMYRARSHAELVLRKVTVAGRRDRHRVLQAHDAVKRAEEAQAYLRKGSAGADHGRRRPVVPISPAQAPTNEEITRSGEVLREYSAWLDRRLT
jgi:hypothetical protein